MTSLRSGTFAAWAASWLAGIAAADDVIAAVTGDDPPHLVLRPDGSVAGLGDALIELRHDGGPVRVVLPVPGDVRGLPGPADFRVAAIDAGEAVCAATIGLVPAEIDHYPSSAPPTVQWQLSHIEPAVDDFMSVADAQQELSAAIRDCAAALTSADVAGAGEDLTDALRSARRAGERLDLPPGHPQRAVALLAQAERLQAVLDLAALDSAGGAIDRLGMSSREASLRPLAVAVRRARLAGYNARN